MALIQKSGMWLSGIDGYGFMSISSLLTYQAIGGFIGGLVAGFSRLSLLSSLMYSLIFCRYFEHVGPMFSSQPSLYISFFMLVVVLIVLLRFFVIYVTKNFKIDFEKDNFVSAVVVTIVGMFIFVSLHYFFLQHLWLNFIGNVM